MTRWWTGLDPGSLLAILALATYLTTAGGHAYSTDGTFAYEMAKSAVLDPEHQYWGRFRSAFARWGVGMPAFAQPFVLGGAALGTLAPERDDIVVDGRRLRVETWPEVRAGQVSAFPLPGAVARGDLVRSITVVSSLANAPTVAPWSPGTQSVSNDAPTSASFAASSMAGGCAYVLPVAAMALLSVIYVTAPTARTVAAGDRVPDAEAFAIAQKHCVMCHAKAPSHPAFNTPPKNVTLEGVADMKRYSALILQQTVQNRAMPLGNQTGMTEDERDKLGRWVAGLK